MLLTSKCQTRKTALVAAAAALIISGLACNAGFSQQTATTVPTEPPPAEGTTPPQEEVTEPPAATEEEATGEAATTDEATEPPAVEVAGVGITCQYVSFTYDESLASGVTGVLVPAEDYGNEGPAWANIPEHVECTFDGYVLPGTFHTPRISIYPVADYEALNPSAVDTVSEMETLLADRPTSPEAVPFLPVFNAAQFMRAKVTYLDFQNGTGVRFLTQYGQAAYPVNNNDMFYAYQGLTADGAYWVSAILPTSHPSLSPDGEDIPGGDYGAFSDNFMNYMADMETTLNGLADGSFTPSLALLDALVQTINVTP